MSKEEWTFGTRIYDPTKNVITNAISMKPSEWIERKTSERQIDLGLSNINAQNRLNLRLVCLIEFLDEHCTCLTKGK